MKRYLPQAVIALVVLVAGGVAVLSLSRGASGKTTSAPQPAVLHWANESVSDLATLDPAQGLDFNARQAAQLIYGGLVRFDAANRVVPDTAQRWTISPDGRTYTFYLRADARFGDGSALSAQDVKYSLERTLNVDYAKNSGAFLLSDIQGAADMIVGRRNETAGIATPSGHIVVIHLQRPSGSFLAKLATPAGYIVAPWLVAGDRNHWDHAAFGTGPFKIARWLPQKALLLIPNPYYYGGKVKLGGVYMPFVPEPLNAYKQYRSGAVDTMGTIRFPTEVLYDVKGRSDFHSSSRLETVYLTLNERSFPFNRTAFRQALSLAVDKQALARDVYTGFAHPTNGLIPPGVPGYSSRISGVGFQSVRARRLLATAGFPGGRGLPPITYLVDQDAQSITLATALRDQWRRVLGVRVTLRQQGHSTYNELLQQRAYQIAVIDWTEDFPDPENFLSQQLRSGVPNNNGNWRNPSFDALVDRADALRPSDPLRLRLYRRAEAIGMRQAAIIPLVNPKAGIMLNPRFHGLRIASGYLTASNWSRVTAGRAPQ